MLSKSWIELPQAGNSRQVFWRWLLGDYIRRAVNRANLYVAIERERKALSRLSDAELRDIGVHRAEADAESRRVFFDVPEDYTCTRMQTAISIEAINGVLCRGQSCCRVASWCWLSIAFK